MLKSLSVKRLFNQFDYEIELKKGGITILTGPNGFGKTTLLKIINSVVTKNVFFLINLPFQEIVLRFANNSVKVTKENIDNDYIIINDDGVKISRASISQSIRTSDQYRQSRDYSRDLIYRLTRNKNEDDASFNYLNAKLFEEYFTMFLEENPSFVEEYINYDINKEAKAYLIKEQRLHKTIFYPKKRFRDDSEIENIVSINNNAKDLAKILSDNLAQSDKIGRENESSYVNRLIKSNNLITQTDFESRYSLINKKKKVLSKFGLYTMDDETVTAFNSDDAKALAIFLEDTEKKLEVLDTLIKKLELFANIINKRSFINKSLLISPVYGFKFIDSYKNEIDLDNLSSGEQHELILIYELIFNVDAKAIVLIDEPEISLHVVWQKEFLTDLEAIIELNKSTVIVATHSPQIINDEWDKTIDLYDISQR